MAYNSAHITAIDINQHPYVEHLLYVVPCFKQISNDFNNIQLITNSTLPSLIQSKYSFDLIHIDGDHSLEGATRDIEELAHNGTIIIVDDTNMSHINTLCNQYIEKGIVSEYTDNIIKGKCKDTYQYRFIN